MAKEAQKFSTETLNEMDESLRVKYRRILDSLTINELKRFLINKSKYEHLIMSKIYEHFPDADSKTVDDSTIYYKLAKQ